MKGQKMKEILDKLTFVGYILFMVVSGIMFMGIFWATYLDGNESAWIHLNHYGEMWIELLFITILFLCFIYQFSKELKKKTERVLGYELISSDRSYTFQSAFLIIMPLILLISIHLGVNM